MKSPSAEDRKRAMAEQLSPDSWQPVCAQCGMAIDGIGQTVPLRLIPKGKAATCITPRCYGVARWLVPPGTIKRGGGI